MKEYILDDRDRDVVRWLQPCRVHDAFLCIWTVPCKMFEDGYRPILQQMY